MYKKPKDTNVLNIIAKRLVDQELDARKRSQDIQKEIHTHKKRMEERRASFKFIRNK